MLRFPTCRPAALFVVLGMIQPAMAKAQGDVRLAARAGVVVRSTPAVDGAVVETLPIRTRVTVLESLGAWLRVATASRVGYVIATDVSASTLAPSTVAQARAPQAMPVMVATPVVYAQVRPDGYKDPTTSLIISLFVPGGGHLYSGETKKGGILLGTALGGLVIGSSMAVNSAYSGDASGASAGLLLGYGAYLGSWIYGLVDSGGAARRNNTKLGYTTAAIPMVRSLSHGRIGYGLALNGIGR